ncbi:MAG TPA: trypsin-like serine protease [Thiotrichaceae bacterium]|jgi:Do/DeqQ family serine protease|nr:trypsin-like serine protease [Thiotrichaceae bacterium]HIM07192.1 trypsin-like serine protease [Gammaproteobacteria bacterium]
MQFKKNFIFILQYSAYGLATAFLFLLLTSNNIISDISFFSFSESNKYSFNKAVSSTAPAVVNVYASKVYQEKIHPLFRDPLFRHFFGDAPTMPKKRRDSSIGSGVIMNAEGYILTNAHVIQDTNEILITLNDGRQSEARLIGLDLHTDLAVIHIPLDNLPVIPIGNSKKMRIGDIVLAIGNPYNFGQTVTQGIVSAISRKRRGISYFDDFIQTDADINQGNSGGALINISGKLIGINSAFITRSGGSEGIGLATPINQALDVLNQIIKNGKVVRGWLGIEAQTLSADVIASANLESDGVLVTAIMHNGPAQNAGLIPGDIMISIDGKNVSSPDQAIETITKLLPGNKVKIKILRGWEQQELVARIQQRPASQMPK